MKKINKKKGFTLIELIVVIAILGILAAIAIPRVGGFQENARVKADEVTAKTLANAVALYNATNTTPLAAGKISSYATELGKLCDTTVIFKSTEYGGTSSASTNVPYLAYGSTNDEIKIMNGTDSAVGSKIVFPK